MVKSVNYPLSLRFDQSFMEGQREWIKADFNHAYGLLRKCKNKKVQQELYIRDINSNLPAEHYKKFFLFTHARILPLETNVIDQYLNQTPPRLLCAYVRPSQPNTIYVNNINNMAVFRKPANICKELWNTLGHEMMHLLNFDHSTEREFHEMNKALKECGFKRMNYDNYVGTWQ